MKVDFYDDYDLVAIRIFGEGVVGIFIFSSEASDANSDNFILVCENPGW